MERSSSSGERRKYRVSPVEGVSEHRSWIEEFLPDVGVVVLRLSIAFLILTHALREFFGVPSGQGLLVRSVERGSNAETAGLKAGDVIVKAQNQPVHSMADLQLAMRNPANGTVSLAVIREKREQTLTLKVPENRQTGESAFSNGWADGLYEELAQAGVYMNDGAALRQFTEQQKAWAKQFKESQKDWEKKLREQLKDLEKQKEKWNED